MGQNNHQQDLGREHGVDFGANVENAVERFEEENQFGFDIVAGDFAEVVPIVGDQEGILVETENR